LESHPLETLPPEQKDQADAPETLALGPAMAYMYAMAFDELQVTAVSDVYDRAGFGRRVQRGTRPAVVVVDLTNGFTDASLPTGADLDEVVSHTRVLVDAAREAAVPVVFTTIAFDQARVASSAWLRKATGMAALLEGSALVTVDSRLGQLVDEALVTKHGASAFFGTDLVAILNARGVDTVLVTGATTSGCVRATVVDAVQYGFTVLVPRECVGDRASGPHEANLFDMDEKYGDVISVDDAVEYVRSTSGATSVALA
jgi:maleamate amidohydrolase